MIKLIMSIPDYPKISPYDILIKMAKLVLIRHTESKWNAQGYWTGWADVDLSDEGKKLAYTIANNLTDFNFKFAYTSTLKRSQQTLQEILQRIHRKDLPTVETHALDERNYGIYTGRNKWEIEKDLGEEEFLKLRRSWDRPIPGGETLKDVYERVVPYYQREILSKLKNNQNVLIVAHGNSLRTLVKFLDNIKDNEIADLDIPVGTIYIYEIDEQGGVINKKIVLSKE